MPLRQIISQKVRKYRIFTIFVIDTFELGQNIRKQTKTRLYRRACLSWLGRTQFPRHKCLRGIPDDLIAFYLSNLLIVEPATVVADYEPWPHTILKRTTRVRLNIGWGARIRTMIKRTKISCPTIRRHPNSELNYIYLRAFCK